MHERLALSFREKIRLNPSKPTTFIGLDFGSTAIKIQTHSNDNPGFELKPCSNSVIISYQSDIADFRGRYFKFMSPKQTKVLFKNLKEKWTDRLSATNDEEPKNVVTTLTGFTQSLAIIYEDKITILLDEPSLSTEPTKKQKKILKKYLGEDGAKKKISTIMKLISLINNPEILAQLLGEPVDLSKVQFSTMLGVLYKTLSNDQNGPTVPLDDLFGFGIKNLTPKKAREMLYKLGIRESQMKISASRHIDSSSEHFYIRNDFAGELEAIKQLILQGSIAPDTIFVGLSSVGKIVVSALSSSANKR